MGDNGSNYFDELLARALEVPAAEQRAFLESHCDDPDLRAEILALLDMEADLGEFIERPAALELEIKEGNEQGNPEPSPSLKSRRLPETVGPYRITGILGEGGMGIVYRAEQDEPIHRELAVKVVRTDLSIPGAHERFMAERQALARLSHPAIAQMYEAGTTQEGFPYFAMELVTGRPITEYCDGSRLSVEERLDLFIQVCEGVQHAHHRGIIHRDLKPSNVLITERDGVPAPKIIDFGIAKALDRPLSETAELTGENLIGTPAYMSPESMGIIDKLSDVDTRSDVYALGILLYELLSGTRPFEMEGTSLASLVLKMAKEDALAPTATFRAEPVEARDRAAQRRRNSPEGLLRRLKGDLNGIVLKAIARNREERYQSPVDLVEDIRRHLSNRPVTATPPSFLYLFGKLVRRHRGAVIAAALLLVSLILGIAGTTVGFVRARSEAERATQEAERANQEASRANREAKAAIAVSDFMVDLFDVSDPWKMRDNNITARELLDRGAEELRGGIEDQPLVLSRFMLTIGRTYLNLGLYDESEALLKGALEVRENHPEANPLLTAQALSDLGTLNKERGRYGEAIALYRRALDIQGENTGTHELWEAMSQGHIGQIFNLQGRYEEAEAPLKRSLAIREESLGPDHKLVGVSLNELGLLYANQGKYGLAEPFYERSLAIMEKYVGPDSPDVALELNNLAQLYDSQGRHEEAEPLYRRALTIYEKALGPDHAHLARSLNNLALVYDKLGQYDEAEPLFRRAVEINEKSVGPDHPYVAICLNNLAVVVTHQERYIEAKPLFERTLKIYGEKLGKDHPRYARTLFRYAEWHMEQGRYAEAEPLLDRAMAIQKEKLPADHPKAIATREAYASLLKATGR